MQEGQDEVIHSKIADEILEDGNYVTLLETQEILEYRNGVYVKAAEGRIKHRIEMLRMGRCTNNLVNEVLGHIRRQTYRSVEEFDSDPFVLNLKNGLLDVRDMSFVAHTPDYLSLSQLDNVEYNPRARAPVFSWFINLVLPDLADRMRTIDFFASTLYRRSIKRAFMGVGLTDSGKSTFLKLVAHFLGKQNISNIPLQDFERDRFIGANLVGKLANIYFDLSDSSLEQTGRFKTRTSGDPMVVQKKNDQPFDFTPFVKELYSCNKIPETKDESSAFFGRWIIVRFPRQFFNDAMETEEKDGKGRKIILPAKDRYLLDKLTTQNELSGILNILIKRLAKIVQLGDIPDAPTEEESRLVWQSSSDCERMFFNDSVSTEDRNAEILRAELYRVYVDWAHKKGITPKTDRAFNDKVKRMLGGEALDTTRDKAKVKLWKGISFKDSKSSNQLKNAVVPVVSSAAPRLRGRRGASRSRQKTTETTGFSNFCQTFERWFPSAEENQLPMTMAKLSQPDGSEVACDIPRTRTFEVVKTPSHTHNGEVSPTEPKSAENERIGRGYGYCETCDTSYGEKLGREHSTFTGHIVTFASIKRNQQENESSR